MVTAAMNGRAEADANGDAVVASESVSMEFVIAEDNRGAYHWTLLDRDGNGFARSPSFASYQDAENAAGVVLAGAGSARLDRRAATDGSLETLNRTKVPLPAKNVDGEARRSREATGAHTPTPA